MNFKIIDLNHISPHVNVRCEETSENMDLPVPVTEPNILQKLEENLRDSSYKSSLVCAESNLHEFVNHYLM